MTEENFDNYNDGCKDNYDNNHGNIIISNIVYISRDLLFIVYISLKAFKKISIMTKLTKVSISSKGWRMGGAYWCKKKKLYKCAEESPSGHRVKN